MRVAVALLLLLAASTPAHAQSRLGRLTGPSAAVDLRSADTEKRIGAAWELGRFGDRARAVAALTAALEAEREVTVRGAIIAALVRRGDPGAVPVLISALESAENLDPASVVLALGAFDDDRAARAVVVALGQEEVADAAARALERMGPRAVPHLIRALDEPALVLAAMRVLGAIGDARATAPLVARTESDREEVRVVAVRALAQLGDRRAAPALVRRLDDPSAEVVLDALHALGRTGEPGQAPHVARRIASGPPHHRRAALAALLRLHPEAAIPVMERAVAAGEPVLARTAIELALSSTHPGMLALLFGLLREGSRVALAADALAELEGGAGIRVLIRVLGEGGDSAPDASRALAIGLRKHRDAIDDETYEAGLTALARAEMSKERGWLLRAVARDPRIGPTLVRGLRAEDPIERATAARALELLGDGRYAADLARSFEDGDTAEGFRRLASAATVLGADVPYPILRRCLTSVETAPEAMAAAARALPSYRPRRREELRRTLRASLRAEHPRIRAGAARALAVAGDRQAWRALVFTLDDPYPEVRLASARALEELGVPEAAEAIEARWRTEEDVEIADALLLAATAHRARRAVPPELGAARGSESVRVRIVAVAEEGRGGVPVDVVLGDGRWLRMRTLPSGELILVDLASSTVDVRVRVGE